MKVKYFIGLVVAVFVLLLISISLNTIDTVDISSTRPIEYFTGDNLYSFYKSKERFQTDDYAVYVFDSNDDNYISEYTRQFICDTKVETINKIKQFILDIPYVVEKEEYPRYPVETIQDNCGDCEDKSILAAAMFYSLGYDTTLIRLPNHMAVGVKIFGYPDYYDGYSFIEVTQSGYSLSDVPSTYRDVQPILHTITERPLFVHSWITSNYCKSLTKRYIVVDVDVLNVGLSNGGCSFVYTIQSNNYKVVKKVPVFIEQDCRLDINVTENIPSAGMYNITTSIEVCGDLVSIISGDFGDEG